MTIPVSHKQNKRPPLTRVLFWALCALMFAFSYWLMFSTFSYNEKGEILISHQIWSDFAATMPLIRSFSLGDNWPPEYPIYPGSPIQYHFLFQWMVAKLEVIGFRIDSALNIPSTLGFFLILLMTYKIAVQLTKDARVGVLATLFFVFNGSLGFIQYFNKQGWNLQSLSSIVEQRSYTAMAPWDGGEVLAFWHLNSYINQRHFVFALGILLLFIWICLVFKSFDQKKKIGFTVLFGVLGGLMLQLHKPVFVIWGVVGLIFLISMPHMRRYFIGMMVVALPFVLIFPLLGLHAGIGAENPIHWHPGFSLYPNATLPEFIDLWWWNWGLHLILAPIGFLLVTRTAKWVMIAPLVIFIIACLFRFSSDVYTNHKFINFFMIMWQMLSAYALVSLYDFVRNFRNDNVKPLVSAALVSTIGLVLTVPMFVMMTLTGFIDLFPIKNSYSAGLRDVHVDPTAKWIYENTGRADVTLNSTLLYAPASTAGRKVFLGWPYFITSAGYDYEGRKEVMATIYKGENPAVFCPLLFEHKITMMTVRDTSKDTNMVPVNKRYFEQNFSADYVSPDQKVSIYTTANLCGSAAQTL